MIEKQRPDDAAFADAILKDLPTTAVPAALQARILADFDRVAVRRGQGSVGAFVVRWGQRLWPGAPVWQPASVLALSLAVGLTVGAFVPTAAASSASTDLVVTALDTTGADTDLDRDL